MVNHPTWWLGNITHYQMKYYAPTGREKLKFGATEPAIAATA